ncbi:MAG TPA: hypothetical protein DIC36_00955, partial [Gammaproteobacteria bacterium]|nr:hypothetical protein [Gammaproteobacteria bacterium]
FDGLADNTANAARIIAEDTDLTIFNELLRSCDEYGATAVTNENLELQADDAKTVFILAHWPVVRPRKLYDLQGTQIGSTTNPITVTYNSVARSEYDGTGTQSAGTYYVINYSLGEIYLVNQAGVVQTPANGTAYTISYSYTTNVTKFDTDLGSDTTGIHWDKFLTSFGAAKTTISHSRYHNPNLGLMSETLMNSVEQAQSFAANYRRPGTELLANGRLGTIKSVPIYDTPAPGLWMADNRVLVGEMGVTRFRVAKPWALGMLENQKDSNGKFTGKKTAYGDQFIFVHTPTQLKKAYTSLVTYSASGRVAR